ncbi:MAG: tRNA pseudouridine(54/55) synthase Pus10 [Candidatus Diapherotrites archaeon]|nr:tRNA pseudouridine(54/55) synthase Pus10 [Candidatus Diapherotrites archaeon]
MEIDFNEMKAKLVNKGLCDRCIGRQFSLLFKGHNTDEIGWAIRNAKSIDEARTLLETKSAKPKMSKQCPLCRGIFYKIPKAIEYAEEMIQNYDFDTFVVGTTVDESLLVAEEKIWEEVGAAYCEPIKKDIVREIGRAIEKKTGKKAEFRNPDITILVDLRGEDVRVTILSHPLFIFGRYRKLVSGIPQTKWYCRYCHGRGCEKCNYTGKMYKESVEEIIAKPIMDVTAGKAHKFHGSGREDIDAKMLGWRPFVIEIKEPIKRNIDFQSLMHTINIYAEGKVEVKDMRKSSKEEVRFLKAIKYDKTYEAIISCDVEVTEEKLKQIEKTFSETTISQRTPKRVLHRRADLTRRKRIKEVRCEKIDNHTFRAVITAESGTYIKEIISGDDGRTKPSFSDILPGCVCKELNVLGVHEHVTMD